jgi:hypothetical protein
MMGATAVVVTPWMMGRRTPTKRVSPADWRIVAMPQVSRSALTRWIVVAVLSPRPWAMSSGTMTAPA